MKTIKTIFAILLLTIAFVACEADSVNEEIGIDAEKIYATEEASGDGGDTTDEG